VPGALDISDMLDLPRHDLVCFVPLDRHDQLFLQVDSLSFHVVQKSPVTSGSEGFSLSLSAQSVTVTPGGSANLMIGATAVGGFNGQITLSCAAPAGLGRGCVQIKTCALKRALPPISEIPGIKSGPACYQCRGNDTLGWSELNARAVNFPSLARS